MSTNSNSRKEVQGVTKITNDVLSIIDTSDFFDIVDTRT